MATACPYAIARFETGPIKVKRGWVGYVIATGELLAPLDLDYLVPRFTEVFIQLTVSNESGMSRAGPEKHPYLMIFISGTGGPEMVPYHQSKKPSLRVRVSPITLLAM